jgi:hypothetical protein
LAALCVGGWLAGAVAAEHGKPGDQAAPLCAEAEAAVDSAALAAFEAALDQRLGLDHASYEAAVGRRDAADGAYFGLLRKLAETIQARMAEAWAAARAAEDALAAAPAGDEATRAEAAAARERARATLDSLSKQFAATPAEQAVAIGPEMVAAYDFAVVEQAAAREALAAIEGARAPAVAAQRVVAQCIARRRQVLLAEEGDRPAAARLWSGDGAYGVTCNNASFNHAGRLSVTRQPDGRIAVALLVPPERGGGMVALDGTMDGLGRMNIAQTVGGVLWLFGGTLAPHPAGGERLQGAGTGRFANPLQRLDCAVQWQLDP